MPTYVPSRSRINLCTNPSFELNLNGWSVSGSGLLVRNTGGFVGTWNAQASAASLSAVSIVQNQPVSAGQAYSLSGYVAQDPGNSGTVNLTASLVWFDSTGATISTSTGSPTSAPVNFVSPQYYRAGVSAVAPTGAVTANLFVSVANPAAVSDVYYFDAILFEQAGSVDSYFDGDSTSTPTLTNAWLGAPDNSTSIQTVYISQTTPTTYRYLFADLITNQILAELPLTGVSFTSVLNGAGSFSGSLLVTDARESYLNIWGATQPARTALYVERFSDGGSPTLVWGGIVWARDYSSASQHITLNASEFESYFDRRRIISNTSASSQVFKNVDPLLLAQTLIYTAQASGFAGAATASNIGVWTLGSSTAIATTAASGNGTTATLTLASAPTFAVGDYVTIAGVTPSGYNGTFVLTAVAGNTISYLNATTGSQTVAGTVSASISKTYFDAELKTVLSAVQDLSKATSSGFDFKIKVAYDGAFNPVKTFTTGYPRLGTAYSASNASAPVMEFPGNVVEYDYFEDGSLAANLIFAVGVGNGQGKLNKAASANTQWAAGWPLLEGSTNYGDVTSQALLNDLAQGQLNAVSSPPVSLKITYPPYQDPILGSYSLGDDIRIRINDDRAGQVDDYYRLVAISVTPGENNQGERAVLTFTQKGAV